MEYTHPTGGRPKSVDLVSLGASSAEYLGYALRKNQEPRRLEHETWTLNRGVCTFVADLCFVLDEISGEVKHDPIYGKALKTFGKPIISTVVDPSIENCYRYPARYILDCIQRVTPLDDPYWHNSVPMIIAYAWAIGVERLVIWGADYTLPDGRTIEDNRANVEYWIGFARARGMQVGVPQSSTLINNRNTGGRLQVYGLVDQREAAGWLKR